MAKCTVDSCSRLYANSAVLMYFGQNHCYILE